MKATNWQHFCFLNFSLLQIIVWMARSEALTSIDIASGHLLQEMETLEEEIFALSEPDQHEKVIESFLIDRTCPKHFTAEAFSCWQINDGCYCVILKSMKWVTALHFCRQFGMELLSLETEEEEQNVANFFKTNNKKHIFGIINPRTYMVSGNRLHGNRTAWMWAGTGKFLSANRNLAWDEGEPTWTYGNKHPIQREECLNWGFRNLSAPVSGTPTWDDLSCDNSSQYFICEFQTSLPSI